MLCNWSSLRKGSLQNKYYLLTLSVSISCHRRIDDFRRRGPYSYNQAIYSIFKTMWHPSCPVWRTQRDTMACLVLSPVFLYGPNQTAPMHTYFCLQHWLWLICTISLWITIYVQGMKWLFIFIKNDMSKSTTNPNKARRGKTRQDKTRRYGTWTRRGVLVFSKLKCLVDKNGVKCIKSCA